MYKELEKWLNTILSGAIPDDVAAFNFNLSEESGCTWSMELVGTERFDAEDEDWACDEITDFGSRDNPLRWHKKAAWNQVLNDAVSAVKEYLDKGKYASVFKSRKGVGIGFVDGDLEIVWSE